MSIRLGDRHRPSSPDRFRRRLRLRAVGFLRTSGPHHRLPPPITRLRPRTGWGDCYGALAGATTPPQRRIRPAGSQPPAKAPQLRP